MIVIGVTGQVGCGKTYAVSQLQKTQSFCCLDLDNIGHEILALPDIQKTLVNFYGDHILDQTNTSPSINRQALAKIVFSDPEKLNYLNQVVHPKIKQHVLTQLETTQQPVAIIVGALIKEIQLEEHCDHIITIDSDRYQAAQFSPKKVSRQSHQLSQEAYKAIATHIVFNNFKEDFVAKFSNLVQNLIKTT